MLVGFFKEGWNQGQGGNWGTLKIPEGKIGGTLGKIRGITTPGPLRILFWLVVSTHLKNISQIGNLPQIGVKIKNL